MSEKNKFDAFFSYNSNDKQEVGQIADWLKNNSKLNIWLDDQEIDPGDNWLKEIEAAFKQSTCCVVFIGKSGIGKWQCEEIEAATRIRVEKKDFKVIPVLLQDAHRPEEQKDLPWFLQGLNWVQFFKPIQDDLDALNKLVQAIKSVSNKYQKPTPSEERQDQYLNGAVVYANVMGFSNLYRDIQDQAIEFMHEELKDFKQKCPDCWIDFKEGEFLIFLQQDLKLRRQYTLFKVFLFGLRLQMKCFQKQFKLGVTLHWEGDAFWSNIGDSRYLIGPALNEAKRFMSFSGEDHFFLSVAAVEILNLEDVKTIDKLKAQIDNNFHTLQTHWLCIDDLKNELSVSNLDYECDNFTFYDRHKNNFSLYNFYINNAHISVGNRLIPNQLIAIEYRDKRESFPNQKFVKRLVEADEVSIIGLTHEGTPDFLEKALAQREEKGKGFWQYLQIIFPSKSTLSTIIENDRTPDERKSRWLGGKRNVYTFLIGAGQEYLGQWECLEYNGNLPFVGDKCRINGIESFRVALVLPGLDMKDVYTSELFQGTHAFTQLSDALTVMTNTCSRFIEWTVYGCHDRDKFQLSGLVNRKNLKSFVDANPYQFCFPVVLIMLHTRTKGKNKSLLQLRTIYNANSDLGSYSNISGRIIDRDVFAAKKIVPNDDYRKVHYSLEFEDTEDAEDIISSEFSHESQISENKLLPEDTWKEAAVREIKEELGLKINPDRLIYQTEYLLERKNMKHSLFFRIFSLRLEQTTKNNEMEIIRKNRPKAFVKAFDLKQLKGMHNEGKLNALLDRRFEEIFLPIFKGLKIEE